MSKEKTQIDYSEFGADIRQYVDRIRNMSEHDKQKFTADELQDYDASLRQIEDGSLKIALADDLQEYIDNSPLLFLESKKTD